MGLCFIVMLAVGSFGKDLNEELNVHLQQCVVKETCLGK